MIRIIRECASGFTAALVLALSLACGGGGGGSSEDGTSKIAPVVSSFTASPASIASGGNSTLSWDVMDASSVAISSLGSVASSGSQAVSPTTTTTYTLTATNAGGTTSRSVTVSVVSGAPMVSFSATPGTVSAGGQSSLSWTVSGATSVVIDHGVGGVAAGGGTKNVSPVATTTYTLTATGPGGTRTAKATVTVQAGGLPTVTRFEASTYAIVSGGSSTLSWAVANATSLSINGGAPQPSTGTLSVSPGATTKYTLTATGSGGTRTAYLYVNVGSTVPNAGNVVTIREEDGLQLQDYPIQIGRPFLQGEIPHYPKVLVNGEAVQTQADVKQRHADGSVKHAILSFLLPELTPRGRAVVQFQDQASGLNDQKLSQAAMLGAGYAFDAGIELVNGTNPACTASARTMLQDGNYTYWMQGPVATSVILADHSVDRPYDMGFQRRATTKLTKDVAETDTQLSVSSVAGFSVGETLVVEAYGGNAEHMTISGLNTATNTITVTNRVRQYGSTTYRKPYSGYWVSSIVWLPAASASYKSFRPIFHATFWPGINKVWVRYIGEISNTESYQDLEYALNLYEGASAAPLYSKATFTHTAGSRWTKSYWLGGYQPSKVSIDHNLAYLKDTRFIPSYDTTKVVPESEIASRYTSWLAKDKDLYEGGWWEKAMFATGGRPDIGPYPTWTVQWLYTGDWRMAEIALKQGELCGAWTYHWREGDPTRYLDQAHTVPGVGHVLSPSSRPLAIAGDWTSGFNNKKDIIQIVGKRSSGDWTWDHAHQADVSSVQYFLTGDYWYLEEMYFMASLGATSSHGEQTTTSGGRGPTGMEGGIFHDGQTRSQAWVFRNRLHAHLIAPDADPEKAWLGQLINDAIAIWEGARDIKGTAFEGTPLWNWGKSAYANYWGQETGYQPPPLHYWMIGNSGSVSGSIDTSITYAAESPWMEHFVLFALGRAEELGHPAAAVRNYLGAYVVGELTDPGYNPYLIAQMRMPSLRLSDQGYFPTWAALKTGYRASAVAAAETDFKSSLGIGDTEHGYPNIALAAASYVKGLPSGNAAWSFMETNALSNPLLNKNPKWALVPRE